MSNHTPGPWKRIAGDILAQSLDGEYDLTICTGCDDENADLIAAAPELLQACISAFHLINDGEKFSKDHAWNKEDTLKRIILAIGKVEGK